MNKISKKNNRRWFNLKRQLSFGNRDNLSFTPQAENDWLLLIVLFFFLLVGVLIFHFFIYSLVIERHNIIIGPEGEELILAEDKINEAYNYLQLKASYQIDLTDKTLEIDS
jgi:hypothetical protein